VIEETSLASRSCVRVWSERERAVTSHDEICWVPSRRRTVKLDPGSIDALGLRLELRESLVDALRLGDPDVLALGEELGLPLGDAE